MKFLERLIIRKRINSQKVKIWNQKNLTKQLSLRIENLKIEHDDEIITTTVSIGVTKLQAQDSFNLAYKRADKALYQSKSDGRNCCRWN